MASARTWSLIIVHCFQRREWSTRSPQPVPSGYPNPTRYPVFLSKHDPPQFSFGNHRVAGNPKHRVLPDISDITRKRKTIPSSGALLWESQKGPKGAKKVQNLPFWCQVWLWNSFWLDCPTWTINVQDLWPMITIPSHPSVPSDT